MWKEKIDRYIEEHRQEMIEDIFLLCRIDSEKMEAEEFMPFGPGAAECLDTALDLGDEYGFATYDYDGYVGCLDFSEELPAGLDILAHLDVVPAGEGWTVTEPFEPVEKDGKLFGRGTADDKGPAVAALYAMRAVKELGIPLKKNVRLILGTDEESGSSDLKHYYTLEKEAPMSFSPDGNYPLVNVEKGRLPGHVTASFRKPEQLPRLCWVKGGTRRNVVPARAQAQLIGMKKETIEAMAGTISRRTGVSFGLDWTGDVLTVSAEGKGAHASTPQEGNNAITALLELLATLPFAPCAQIEALRELAACFPHGAVHGEGLGVDMEDEISGRMTLTLDVVTIGETSLDGEFDARVPVCGTKENVLRVARGALAAGGLTLENDSMTPPHVVPEDSELVQTLLQVYEEFTGQKGECQSMGGGTYVHNLENGVCFGASMPGVDNKMHGPDEFANVSDLLTSAKIFALAIVRLCG